MKVKYLLLIVALYLFQTAVIGQESKRIYKKSITQEGASYLESAKANVNTDPTKAIELVQKALQYSIPAKNYKVEGESYQLLANLNTKNKQYDLAINYFEKGKAAFEKGNYLVELKSLLKDFTIPLRLYSQLDKALNVINEVESLMDKSVNSADKVWVNENRAQIYKLQGKFNEAIQELELAESMVSNSSLGTQKKAQLKLEKGGVYEEQQNNTKARQEYDASELIARSVNDKQGVLNSNSLQSKLLEKEGKKKEAVEKKIESLNYLNSKDETATNSDKSVFSEMEPIEVKTPINIAKEESKLNMEIGKSYLDLEKNEKAIDYLKNAVSTSSKSGEIQTKKDAIGLLSEAYSRAGKFNEALISYKNYVGLVDSIYNLKEAQILASLDLNNELNERLQRIASLEKDRTIQKQTIELLESQRRAEEESNKSLKTLIYSLIFGLLLLLLVVYFLFRSSKQKKITNQLLALKNLRTQMNPHFIFNALNSVNNFISVSDERSANRYLSEFSRLMRLVLENSEHDFIPLSKELEILDLYVGLEHSRFSEKFDYELNIDSNLNVENFVIPPMIVQPYIENAVWHGLRYLNEKGQLLISIKEENSELFIVIEDNGVGRTKSRELKTKNQQQMKSTAMRNIEERLKIINGLKETQVSVIISDLKKDGSGTKVEIKVS